MQTSQAIQPTLPDPQTVFRGLVRDLTAGELELPGFPQVVVRLQRTIADESAAVKDVTKLIQTEPNLSAQLLKLANSAAFNKSGREFSDLKATITNLGFNIVRAQASAYAMKQLQRQEWLAPIRPQLNEIWSWSNGTAALCHAIGKRMENVQPDEALATGLFHQLGKLYLYARALRDGVDAGQIPEWQAAINDWHPAIARAILENWHMPDRMSEAMDNQNALFETEAHLLPPLSRTLAAAKLLYRRGRRMARGEDDAEGTEILDRIYIGGKKLIAVIDEAGGEIEAMRQAMA